MENLFWGGMINVELVYLTTTACNYRCKHCNSYLWTKKDNELSIEEFIQIFEASEVLQQCIFNIAGGEPFLKKDIVDLIAYLNQRGVECVITTNGKFTDKIKELVFKLEKKERIHFAVSIDGDEKTHNNIRGGGIEQNAYRHAYETTQLLTGNGFNVQINMVIQKDNYPILDKIGKEFEEMGAVLNYIPMVDYDEQSNIEKLSHQEIQKVYPYLKYNRERKLLLSRGKYKIRDCHAGKSSWILDSNGDVYCCYGFICKDSAKDFFLGNVRESGFDTIISSEKVSEVYEHTVKNCDGCAWPCEIVREVDQYGLSTEVTLEEEQVFFDQLSSDNKLENSELDNANWYDLEKDENGRFRWMRGSRASAFLRIEKASKYMLNLSLVNAIDNVDGQKPYVKCFLNGLLVDEEVLCVGMNKFMMPLNLELCEQIVHITIETNVKWCPAEQSSSNDDRLLGLAVYGIEITALNK